MLREKTLAGMNDEDIGFYDGLVWYLETRNWAFEKMLVCPRGSCTFDVRIYHSQYFVNLLSAVDHVCDYIRDDGPTRGAFVTKIEVGMQNYEYVRELRNAIVHRGLDPTADAHADDTTLHVLCPAVVQDRSRLKSYKASFKYLVELAHHCNSVVNPAIADVLTKLGLFNAISHTCSVEDIKAQVRSWVTMPDWAKELSIKAWDEVNYSTLTAEMATIRFQKMQDLLGLEPR
jgi:hypothetical protein